MTQINWQYQVNNRAGGYIVTATDWNDFAGNFRAFIDQTTGSGTTDNSPLPIGIDLVNDRVYISDPDSTTPEDANHADTTLSVVGTTTLAGNTQQTGTFTVGVDDTGHDVKFFGATASSYLEWDESLDSLILNNSGQVIKQDNGIPSLSFESFNDTEANSGRISFYKADNTQASPQAVDDNASLGQFRFYGYDGDSYAYGAFINVLVDGTPGDGDIPTEMQFGVSPDGSETPVTAITIKPSGETRFTADKDITAITGTTTGNVSLYNSDTTIDDFTCLDFIGNGTQPAARVAMKYTSSGSELHFGTSNSYGSGITHSSLKILPDGDIQVGVDDTGYDITVYGDESGSYMMWDASSDDLEFFGNSKINLNGTTAGSSNFQINFAESYNILADNTGTGSDNSRLWFSGNAGGSCYIGPRAGGSLFEDIFLRADVTVSGALSKGSGSFDIPHPTKGGDWRLRHSFLEGPTCDNIYRGTTTISGSSATIDLDTVSNMTAGTWEALNTNTWSMVSSSGNAVTWSLSGKTLTINGPNGAVCNWMVIGERKDDNIKGSKQTDSNGKLITEYENADIDADADA